MTPEKKEIAEAFGVLIRDAREKQGLRQVDVAEQIGISRAYYTHIEAGGRDLPFTTAVSICRTLGLSIDDFVKYQK